MTRNSILWRYLRRCVAIASLSKSQIKLIENTVNKLVGLRLSMWALKIVVGAREQGTLNWEQEESFD
ncbi:hypothetical protein [Dolichospermum compactum]|uniref:Uncharacterized protein n=1 Tax=Dolichospermum compactum NIES-806 TaxID=1973481 RepID=A0A1Z4UXC0_9CYAN|nr:hypothetical protein [Dolichospermum compactum]BAZ83897.1 hypothetical protein NIES806_00770 [Dolichospermum compactum NIES-806]